MHVPGGGWVNFRQGAQPVNDQGCQLFRLLAGFQNNPAQLLRVFGRRCKARAVKNPVQQFARNRFVFEIPHRTARKYEFFNLLGRR